MTRSSSIFIVLELLCFPNSHVNTSSWGYQINSVLLKRSKVVGWSL